jgi:hypothetical protein
MDMNMLYRRGHAASTSGMDMQHGHRYTALEMGMQHVYGHEA